MNNMYYKKERKRIAGGLHLSFCSHTHGGREGGRKTSKEMRKRQAPTVYLSRVKLNLLSFTVILAPNETVHLLNCLKWSPWQSLLTTTVYTWIRSPGTERGR